MRQSEEIVYAGFWRRLTAFILDLFLFNACVAPILVAIYGRNYSGTADFIFTLLLPIALTIVFWVKLGATPGKLLLDCRIVDVNTLQPIGWKQAGLRCVGYAISVALFCLGFLWIAWDKRKQGLHDKLVNTVVLHQADDYALESLPDLMRPTS